MSIEHSASITLDDLDIRISKKTAEKRGMLNNIKADPSFLEATLSVMKQDLAESDIKTKVERTRDLAAKYCREMLKAIEQHIRSLPTNNFIEICEQDLAIEAFNFILALDTVAFIEEVLNTIRDQITEDQQPSDHVATSLSFHASLLFSDFNDNWLPLEIINTKLNQITACLLIIEGATTSTFRGEIALAGELTSPEHAAALVAETSEPVFDTTKPLPPHGAVPKDLARYTSPSSDAPTTRSTILAHRNGRLITAVTAISLVGMAIGFARRKSSIDTERHQRAITKAPIARPTIPNITPSIVAQPVTSATVPVALRPATPVSIATSSNFAVADLTHSPLEEGVRHALLAQTVALGHCLTNPNDAIYLAYGLRRPITDQLRRARWQVGNIPSQRGITITWTDNGQCNDFRASGWELNDAGARITTYPPTRIRIATDIATIAHNQKLYHHTPIAE